MQSTSYGRVYRFLHWGMALLVLFAIALVEIKDFLPGKNLRHEDMALHIQAGLAIFFLIWVRMIWRATNPVPPIFPALTRMQQAAANCAHGMLYFMMIALPVLGILALQSKGKAVNFLGFPLPVILDEYSGLPYALTIRRYHELLGNVLIGLIALHVLAAILHHWLRRDNTLVRMLPWLKRNEFGRETVV